MVGSVKSRKVAEPKLLDLTSDRIAVGDRSNKGSNASLYWTNPAISMSSVAHKSPVPSPRQTAGHVGFKEPLVSYHKDNDPLNLPVKESEILLTPKDKPAVTRFLNTFDAITPTKPNFATKQLNATGISKTVTHKDAIFSDAAPLHDEIPLGDSGTSLGGVNFPDHLQTRSSPRNLKSAMNRHQAAETLKQRRKMEQSSEALAKLKETIKKQKENRSPSGVSLGVSEPSSYRKHDDIVISTPYSRPPDQTPIRKIAVGPAAPKYKGFSAAETRLQTPDGKIWKEDDFREHADTFEFKKPKGLKIDHHKVSSLNKSQVKRKPVRKLGKIQANHPIQKKTIITPSSWREGQRIAEAIIASTSKQPNPLPEKLNVHHTKGSNSISTTEEDSSGKPSERKSTNNELISDRSKVTTTNKPDSTHALFKSNAKLSEEAIGVLEDLNQPPSDSEPDVPIDVPNKDAKSPVKKTLKRKSPLTPKKEVPEIPKTRHYDPVQVQQYMVKQKADRKRKQAEEKRLQKEAQEKKTKLLSDLDKRQKEARKKTLTSESQAKEKVNMQETFTKNREKPDLEPPLGYEDRLASFMKKLEKITGVDDEEGKSPKTEKSSPRDQPVSKFLLRLGECINDTSPTRPALSDRSDSARSSREEATSAKQSIMPDRPTTIPSFYLQYTSSKSPDASYRQIKIDRIAALRAKSESLQERIEQESKRLLEQPALGLSYAEKFSPRPYERSMTDYAAEMSPRIHISTTTSPRMMTDRVPVTSSPRTMADRASTTSSPIHKSSQSSDLSYPGVSASLFQEKEEMKTPDPEVHIRPSPRDVSTAPETWEVINDMRSSDHSRSGSSFSGGSEVMQADSFSIADMMYRLNKEEFCAKEKPALWKSRLYENNYDEAGTKHHYKKFSSKSTPSYPDQHHHIVEDNLRQMHFADDAVPPWKRSNGDKYSVANLFTKKYLKCLKPVGSSKKEDFTKDERRVPFTSGSNDDIAKIPTDAIEPPALASNIAGVVAPTTEVESSANFKAKSSQTAPPDQHVSPRTPRDTTADLIKWSETLGRASASPRSEDRRMVIDSDSSLSSSEPQFRPLPLTQPTATMRFSPAVLEQKLALELNRYETIEEQINQLAASERTQGVAIAQQESVSIAQILQSRQQQHELEMERLALQAKEKALEASHKLKAVQMEATVKEAEEKEKIVEERGKMVADMQAEARKKLQLQTDVAQASINALTRFGRSRDFSDLPDRTKPTSSFSSSRSTEIPTSSDHYRSSSFDTYTESMSKREAEVAEEHSPTSIVSEHSTTSVRIQMEDDSILEEIVQSEDAKGGSSNSSIKEVFDIDTDDKTDRSISEDIPASPSSTKNNEKGSDSKFGKKTPSKVDMEGPTTHFDDTLTEDEMIEISKRAVIPTESHRRHQYKKSLRSNVPSFRIDQSDVSVSSDDVSPIHNKGNYFSGLDDSVASSHSLFGDADISSFSRFMNEHLRQYILEEEVRARHQAALLKVREKALKEKTEVELAWLKFKKREIRNKGEDDKMPPLKKKERAILLRWQVESEEIKKLKAANKAAIHDRVLMKRQQDINRMMINTQPKKEKLKSQTTEFDGKQKPEMKSSTPVPQLMKSEASESEDMSEIDVKIESSPTESLFQMLPKSLTGLDDRRLTAREKALFKRKKEAEKLLVWKRKLDEEEKKVFDIEKQALDAWGEKKPAKILSSASEKDLAADVLDKDDTPSPSKVASTIPEEVSPRKATEGSVSSLHADLKSSLRDQEASSEDTICEEYSQSFDSVDLSASNPKSEAKKPEEVAHDAAKATKSSKAKVSSGQDEATVPLLGDRPATIRRVPRRRESQESWSDESFSQTQSETEQSDVECRVHALKEELRTRRLIADRLKKQQKKKRREHLRAQEASLKSQIEAYDAFIKSTQQELNLELESPSSAAPSSILTHASAAKPQIRSPRKSEQNRHINRSLRQSVPSISSPDASPRSGSQRYPVGSTLPKQYSDSESSGRSSRSLSFDEEQQSPDDATTPNGTAKNLLHGIPSRATDKPLSTTADVPAPLQDRPKKLDFPAKSLRSMIPIPTKLSNRTQQEKRDDAALAKPSVNEDQLESLKPAAIVSPTSSDEYDKEVSIATEEEVSEHLSEASTEKSSASIPLFNLSQQNADELIDDDKTPVASPATTPTPSLPQTPTPEQAENAEILSDFGYDTHDGAIGTRIHLSPPEVFDDDTHKKKLSEASEIEEEKQATFSNRQVATDLSDNLFSALLKESVDSALVTRKSAQKRSKQTLPPLKDAKKHSYTEEVEADQKTTTPETKRQRHSDAAPKLTSTAQSLLQLLAGDKDEAGEKAERVTTNVTDDLVHDTLSKVLAIRKTKESQVQNIADGSSQKSPLEQENGNEIEDIVKNADGGESERTIMRPVSPVFGTSQDTDEYFDDDFGLSATKPNQQYDFLPEDNWTTDMSLSGEGKLSRLEIVELEYAIPHKPEDVLQLVDQAVDYLYMKQMNGELFSEKQTLFDDYDVFHIHDEQLEPSMKADRVFKNSIFDLVRDLLRDVFRRSEEKTTSPPWHKVKRRRRPSFCRAAPKSKTDVATAIREEVARLYGFPDVQRKSEPRISLKWGSSKKKDSIDMLLIEELKDEEADWTDYDLDEAAVKTQLTETVFDLLINDTITCLNRIEQNKRNPTTSV